MVAWNTHPTQAVAGIIVSISLQCRPHFLPPGRSCLLAWGASSTCISCPPLSATIISIAQVWICGRASATAQEQSPNPHTWLIRDHGSVRSIRWACARVDMCLGVQGFAPGLRSRTWPKNRFRSHSEGSITLRVVTISFQGDCGSP